MKKQNKEFQDALDQNPSILTLYYICFIISLSLSLSLSLYYICMYVHIYANIGTHIDIYIYIHTYTYIHRHTHTLKYLGIKGNQICKLQLNSSEKCHMYTYPHIPTYVVIQFCIYYSVCICVCISKKEVCCLLFLCPTTK